MRSTMRGETADMVNKFRELKLKEYCQITKLCKMNGIILSERLLEKGININFWSQYTPYLGWLKYEYIINIQ
jgi:hypothetical protein